MKKRIQGFASKKEKKRYIGFMRKDERNEKGCRAYKIRQKKRKSIQGSNAKPKKGKRVQGSQEKMKEKKTDVGFANNDERSEKGCRDHKQR